MNNIEKIITSAFKILFGLAVIASIIGLITMGSREDHRTVTEGGMYKVIEKHIGTSRFAPVVYIVLLKKVGLDDYRAVTDLSANRYVAFKIGELEALELKKTFGCESWRVIEELKAKEAN